MDKIEKSKFPILLRCKEAAGILGVKPHAIYHYIKNHPNFPYRRMRFRILRIPRDEFFAWIDKHKGA